MVAGYDWVLLGIAVVLMIVAPIVIYRYATKNTCDVKKVSETENNVENEEASTLC